MKNFIKKTSSNLIRLTKRFKHYIYMAMPFIVMDLLTRFYDKRIDFFSITEPVPTLFTILYVFLFIFQT